MDIAVFPLVCTLQLISNLIIFRKQNHSYIHLLKNFPLLFLTIMTTPIFVITPVNDCNPEAVTKSIHGRNNYPAFYTLTTIDGEVYAGSAEGINNRLSVHKCHLKSGKHAYPALQNAVEKELPIQVTVEYMPSRDAAYDAEQVYLTSHASNPNLLNKSLHARSPNQSDEGIQRLREFRTGKIMSEETRQKISDSLKGRPCSEAALKANSQPVEIEGIMHPSLRGAGKALGVSELTIRNRINSSNPKFSNYSFK